MQHTLENYRGCILGALLGDSLGLNLQGKQKREIPQILPVPKKYGDDFDSTCIVLEALLDEFPTIGDVLLKKISYENFLPENQDLCSEVKNCVWYNLCQKSDLSRNYSTTTKKIIEEMHYFLLACPDLPQNYNFAFENETKGCLMYASSIAIFCSIRGLGPEHFLSISEIVEGSIFFTHNSQVARSVSLCYVFLLLQLFWYPEIDREFFAKKILDITYEISKEVFHQVYIVVENFCNPFFAIEDALNASRKEKDAIDTLAFVLYYVLRYWNDPLQGIEKCLRSGGDTDTMTKMVAEVTGIRYPDLFDHWVKGLEGYPRALNVVRKIKKC